MSGDQPFPHKTVSPLKCNEKPWDQWTSEIGYESPRRDDEFTPQPAEGKSSASSRRPPDHHPYKTPERARQRRARLNRLKYQSMSLHGVFPQMDNLNAVVCHMCGAVVKCSAAYRHLIESHSGTEPLLPPPPPVSTVRSRSRHKKETPPPPPPEPIKMETSPVHTATAPLSRIVLPQPEMQYLEEPSTSAAVTGEVQVCMESGELPVVSIQDTEDLPLGEHITDDIFAIMNSEGIQSAEDITNAADWKNIIRDIGNMQEINFPVNDPVQAQDLYGAPLPAYSMTDTDLSSMQFAPPSTSPLLLPAPAPEPAPPVAKPPAAPTASTSKAAARSKTSKSKFNLREYDPNKHCGVVTVENPKPCTRSLTCKAHALSLRRTVEGRSKPFDTLLAEHRASRDAGAAAPHAAASHLAHTAHPAPHPAAAAPLNLPPLLVNTSLDLSAFNGLTDQQQVNDIYKSLLEDPDSVLPDASTITSLLVPPLPNEPFLLPEEAQPTTDTSMLHAMSPAEHAAPPDERADEGPPTLVPTDVYWYAACPRPLALCTFNASHSGGAVTLGKKFATVRSNIKSSLTRSQCKSTGGSNSYYYGQNSLSLSKTVHMNASKCSKPEVRKLIVTCSGVSGGSGGAAVANMSSGGSKEVQQALSELFGTPRHALNGHVGHAVKLAKRPPPAPAVLDLGFALDAALLADEKC
ncbi:ataxin-7-like protein 1 [Manduca sexta]|uniref:SCA7 domain-containing protein n=1 Tax=Manduca sexta TaxID=7130 RepID=A0A921YWS2_MANSE|nr:ataxin-7-like protein 1 [Manduca sexta]KAG6446783.1 hypothetical protein O3G_MSEX004607 [Manduca sexta]